MVRPAAALVLWAAFAASAFTVQVPDLTDFFRSPNGLSLSYSDAAKLANGEVGYLTQCGITVPNLQALRDAMYKPNMLNIDLATVRAKLLTLAYQHTSPADLNTLYQVLRSSIGLSSRDAQTGAIDLAMKHARPSDPKPLFQVLQQVVMLPTFQAQQLAIKYAAAGTDPGMLNSVFQSSKRAGMSRDAALDAALSAAVVAELYGLPGRYAKDGSLYIAKDFQQYYRTTWFDEWQASPEEKRTAPDGKDYRASDYAQYFGSNWNDMWASSPIAELRRIASDGHTYTLKEFMQYYKDSWQSEWAQSYEVLDMCAGLDQLACSRQQTCQWSWSGDPTTSCVVRPHADEVIVV